MLVKSKRGRDLATAGAGEEGIDLRRTSYKKIDSPRDAGKPTLYQA